MLHDCLKLAGRCLVGGGCLTGALLLSGGALAQGESTQGESTAQGEAVTQSPAPARDDGRRAVKVDRFGVTTRVPQAWRLVDWSRDAKAFVLQLPQDAKTQQGFVVCELGVAPESLAELHKREQASDAAEQQQANPKRRLLRNELETLDAGEFGDHLAGFGERLVNQWEVFESEQRAYHREMRIRLIAHGTLYTFSLVSDEAHYDAYELDFEDMFKLCTLRSPETGVQRMPRGYWMQREFRFAMRLPDGWRPAFGPDDKVLFFATGKAHEVFTDNLLVLATLPRPLDLEQLKATHLAEIARLDPGAKVTAEIVPQGATQALETLVQTERGPLKVTVLERRFHLAERNYEVKFTCESSEFEKIKDELRRSLDTFIEVAPQPVPSDA